MTRLAAAVAVLAAALAGLASGCGGDSGSVGATLTVYVSVPLSGESAAAGRSVATGARQALDAAGGRAGGYRVRARYLDDTGGGARWDPVATAANARRASEDSTAIGYIGDLSPAATRTSLPITNEAEILQVDPGTGPSYLTRHVGEDLDPERYRPSGDQTFVALLPAGGAGRCGNEELGREAMSLILDAIARGGADRDAVIEAALATSRRGSPLGAYSVNANGEVVLEDGRAACA